MAFIIDTINGSGLYAQSAASASVATYDSNGNVITATYITAHQPISANEWNDVYNTVNINSGAWTGSESSPTASVDSNGSIDIVSSNNTVYFDVNGTWFNNAVNSAVDVPTGVMVESACEYNAVNEISGYNGSAIAQYGAEKQWLQHDDTIVHVANSAQYAFGVNVSALQQLMGIDETLLWSGTITAINNPITLTEPYTSFNKIKFTFDLDDTKVDVIQPVIKNGEVTTQFGNSYGAVRSGGAWWECWNIVKFSADDSCTITATKALLWGVNTTATTPANVYNDWTWTVRNLCEIRGIGRKS